MWLIEEKGEVSIIPELGETFINWGAITCQHRYLRHAIVLFDRAIAIFQSMRAEEKNDLLAYGTATASVNKSAVLLELREYPAAVDACDWAIVILSRLLYRQQTDCRAALSGVYFNKAHIYDRWRKPQLAWGWATESVALYQNLVHQHGQLHLERQLQEAEHALEKTVGQLQRLAVRRGVAEVVARELENLSRKGNGPCRLINYPLRIHHFNCRKS
jgi:hypothetical protein